MDEPVTPLTPLAAYLLARMEARGMKQEGLARASRLSQPAISQMLAGQIRNPTGKAICKLKRGLGDETYDPIMAAVCATVDAA